MQARLGLKVKDFFRRARRGRDTERHLPGRSPPDQARSKPRSSGEPGSTSTGRVHGPRLGAPTALGRGGGERVLWPWTKAPPSRTARRAEPGSKPPSRPLMEPDSTRPVQTVAVALSAPGPASNCPVWQLQVQVA